MRIFDYRPWHGNLYQNCKCFFRTEIGRSWLSVVLKSLKENFELHFTYQIVFLVVLCHRLLLLYFWNVNKLVISNYLWLSHHSSVTRSAIRCSLLFPPSDKPCVFLSSFPTSFQIHLHIREFFRAFFRSIFLQEGEEWLTFFDLEPQPEVAPSLSSSFSHSLRISLTF